MLRIEMKPGATRKLRYMPQTRALLEGYGTRLMVACNRKLDADSDEQQGYRMSSRPGARRPYGRWRVSVIAVTPHAKYSDRKHNTLIKEVNQL